MAENKKNIRKHKWPWVVLLVMLLISILLFDSNVRIVKREYHFEYDSLPNGFSGFKIAQISDLHGTDWLEHGERICDILRKESPDIIAVTGDFIDSADQLAFADGFIKEICKIAPVYYITGNHEWPAGVTDELFDMFEAAGAVVLRNEYTILEKNGEKIALVGLEDPNGPFDMEKPHEVMEKLRREEGDIFTATLVHRTTLIDEVTSLGTDVLLCGHSHGGIIRLPFAGGVIGTEMNLFPKYDGGVFSINGADVVVSRGLGKIYRLLRLFNNPEIPIICLETV